MPRLVNRHSWPTRLCHWLNVPVLGVMVWSGIAISGAKAPYTIRIGARTILTLFSEDFFRQYNLPDLAAALTVSYSRARIEASMSVEPSDGVFGLASRDVRSLIAAIGTVLGQCYWTLAVLAAASALTVAFRLVYLRFRTAD